MPTIARTPSAPLAYVQIKGRLLKRLEKDWPPGSKLPATPELARLLNAGQSNTHRAVQSLVAEGRLTSRRGSGTFVAPVTETEAAGSSTAPPAPSLAGKRIQIFTANSTAMTTAMVTHASSLIHARQGEVTLRALPKAYAAGQLPDDFDGAILINPNSVPAIEFADHQIITVISTRANVAIASSGRYDVVSVDEEQAGYAVGEWARRLGFTHASFVGVDDEQGEPFDRTSMTRLRAFEQGFARPVAEADQISCVFYGPMNGAMAAATYVKLNPRPDVVFCASDELAVGFAMGASSHGLQPGRDFRLVGFDRQQLGHELAGTVLTTVEVPSAEMGRRAAEMLSSRFENPDQPVRRLALGCTLAIGNT